MADATFNMTKGATTARKTMLALLNVGTGATNPTWAPMGISVEDSSIEYDWQEESTTDILGNTWNTAKAPKLTQTFDASALRGGDEVQQKIWSVGVKDQDVSAMTNMDVVVAHLYEGDASGGFFAERYPASMVKPSGLGGSGTVDMGYDVSYGGEREVGTVKQASGGGWTFTKASS